MISEKTVRRTLRRIENGNPKTCSNNFTVRSLREKMSPIRTGTQGLGSRAMAKSDLCR